MTGVSSLLLIEDHRDIAEMIIDYFEAKGFVVDHAADGVTGMHLAVTNPFDLIILDLSLPGIDGIEVCRQIRQTAKLNTPILMLTARDSVEQKLEGFGVGADDYLVKPFAIEELEARINARLKPANAVDSKLVVGDLIFEPSELKATRSGVEIKLTPTTAKILEVLMRAAPKLISKSELERKVWGDDIPDSDVIRSHIYGLRKNIDKPFEYAMIKNTHGGGYKLDETH